MFRSSLRLIVVGIVLFASFEPVQALTYSLPFRDNFDTSSVWTVQQVRGSSWQQGSPSYGTTSSSHSSPSCWDVELNSSYRDSTISYLVSPQINFNGEYNARLSFWQNFNTEDYFDGARLEFALNGGGWITLGLASDPNAENWYSRNNIASSNRPAWCGSSNGWIQSSFVLVPLNGFSGNVQFRFVFTSSDSVHADGYSIDDFFIDQAPVFDAGIVSLFYPMHFALENALDSVQCVLKNLGGSAINSLNVGYSVNAGSPVMQAWTGNLLPAETDTIRFATPFIVSSGMSQVCVFTQLTGDGDLSNDTVCKMIEGIPFISLPYADDFENAQLYWHDSSDAGTVWESGIPAFGSTSSVNSGTSCWDINLNSAYLNHASSYLYSSFFDFTNVVNARLSFWQNRNTEKGFDGMCLEYSTDAGMNWNLLGSYGEENSSNWYNDSSVAALGNHPGWDGNSNGWVKSSCILSSLNNSGSRVQFRFRFQSDGSTTSDGVSIDDISIQLAPSIDLSLNKLFAPDGNLQVGTSTMIHFRTRNLGTNDITHFDVNYGVEGEALRTWTWNGMLPASSSLDFIIDTLVYRNSDFIFEMKLIAAGDGDNTNDSIQRDLYGIPQIVPPFSDHMESVRNFYSENATSIWEWGVPTSTIINTGSNGNKSWKTNLDGDYTNRCNDFLYSPFFDFSNAYHPEIHLRHWFNTEAVMDGTRIEYSTDGGNSFSVLGTQSDPMATNWYNSSNIFSSGKAGWTGTSNGYIESTYMLNSLSGYSGALVQFRFNLSSNDSVTANGWSIDEFRIESQPAWSASPSVLTDVQNPFSANASSQIVGCYIVNTGAMSITSVQLNLLEDGQNVLSDSVVFATPLLPGDSVLYTFSQAWIPSPGLHTLCTQTSLPNQQMDQWTADDEKCSVAGVFDTLPIISLSPWCEDFEGLNSKWLTMDPNTQRFQSEEWSIGNPNQTYLNGTYNGLFSWVTGALNSYTSSNASALYSPVFLADSASCYSLSFYHRYKTEQFEDGGTVEYSIDNGGTWKVIGNAGEPDWFNSSYITGLKLPPVPGWSGTNLSWELAKHDLFFPKDAAVVFRFRFGSDASVEDEGWEIDQFCLQKLSTCVIGLDELDENSLSVFPNPAQDKLFIADEKRAGDILSVTIENALGEMMKQAEWEPVSTFMNVNLSDFQSGLYTVRIQTTKGVVVKKFVKL